MVVSKLLRFNASDISDIRSMADKGLLKPENLAERFQSAVDAFSVDARADDLPKCLKNLHTVERDFLEAPESDIELPSWLG